MIDLELSSQNGMNESSENKMLETGLGMKQALDRLISIYSDYMNTIKVELKTKSRELLFPLISIELVLYIVCIVGCWFWFRNDNEESFTSLMIELVIAIPVLFLYCDWNLCQDLYDKRRNIERFAAIELRLKKLATTQEPWDDLVVEFEEGEVFYCFVFRDNHWQRWPVLLLVDGDIVCFPNNSINVASKSVLNLKYSVITKLDGNQQFLPSLAVSDIVRFTEAPIISFFDNVFGRNVASNTDTHNSFWTRVNRWIHGDLSQQGVLSNEKPSDYVNSKNLNYSAYSLLFHNLFSFCTVISWICVVILFAIHITSIQVSTFRLLFATFFVCPLAVSMLECFFQFLYIAHSIGYWKYMKITKKLTLPSLKTLVEYFKEYYFNPLDFIPKKSLLSLPYCTTFNVLSKNVVCRDYPCISTIYTATKSHSKSHFPSTANMQLTSFEDTPKEKLELMTLSLFHSTNKLFFYDNAWREKLNTLKPTGLLTLLMSRGNKIFAERHDYVESQDILNSLTRYMMILSNNYYKESFYEVADIIGFLKEDMASQNIQCKINIINDTSKQSTPTETPTETPLSLRNKLGGYYFGDLYIYLLSTITNSLDILVVGSIRMLLPYLGSIWTGHHLKPMTPGFRESILSIEQKNNQQFIPTLLVAHNTIPLSELDSLDESLKSEIHKLTKGNLFISLRDSHSQLIDFLLNDSHFLSLLAVDDVIKDNLPTAIDQLSQLGIRYVYYSPYNYYHSRKLAARMGLETGWNTAISLSADVLEEERLQWDDYAKLPHGVEEIKKHLETQDNVPLLVHLFTHSDYKGIEGMLDVLSDWGEGVISICNSSFSTLPTVLTKSRFLIAMNQFDSFVIRENEELVCSDLLIDQSDSIPTTSLSKELQNFYLTKNPNKEVFHLNELLYSSQATLHIDNRTDISIFPVFFNQSKVSSNNINNILLVCVSVIYAVNFSLLYSWLFNFPPLLNAGSLYLLLFCIIPLFCLFLFTSNCNVTENNMFELLPWKPLNKGDVFKIDRVFYTRLWTRFLMIFLSFILSLSFLWVYLIKTYSPYKDATLFSFILRKELHQWLFTEKIGLSLRDSVNFFVFIQVECMVYLCCVLLMNRNHGFIENLHQENAKHLTIFFIIVIILTILVAESSSYITYHSFLISRIPWYLIVITLVYYVVFVVVDGVLMKKETKVTMELNQIYRWNFDTRLGMWSPA